MVVAHEGVREKLVVTAMTLNGGVTDEGNRRTGVTVALLVLGRDGRDCRIRVVGFGRDEAEGGVTVVGVGFACAASARL